MPITSKLNCKNGLKLKIFVKETNNASIKTSTKLLRKHETLSKGGNAREFYENLIKEPSQALQTVRKINETRSLVQKKTEEVLKFRNKDLLTLAQNNDVKNINLCLSDRKNFDINVVDDYGWTPLMCAACNGAADAVKVLLENNADPYIYDKSGNTALKLALQKNYKSIVDLLKNFENIKEASERSFNENLEKFYCEICKEYFTAKRKHENSTLHLFNCKYKSVTFYGIPESNKGFQLLLKEGWNKEHGLGPSGNGRKFPVKAVTKKDRAGIGSKVKGKIEKISTAERHENKKTKQFMTEWEKKKFERNFRLEFS